MNSTTEGLADSKDKAPAACSTEHILEIVDLLGRRIMMGVGFAGLLVALAIYWQPAPKHWEAFVANGEIIRVNTRNGSIVACNAERCMQVLKSGQRLQRFPEGRLFEGQAAAAQLPPPAQQKR